jgi:hypothetical protein
MMEQAVGVRDSRGRWRDGVSGNPRGRPRVAPERKHLLKLLDAASAAGAQVIVLLPRSRSAFLRAPGCLPCGAGCDPPALVPAAVPAASLMASAAAEISTVGRGPSNSWGGDL